MIDDCWRDRGERRRYPSAPLGVQARRTIKGGGTEFLVQRAEREKPGWEEQYVQSALASPVRGHAYGGHAGGQAAPSPSQTRRPRRLRVVAGRAACRPARSR